MSGTDGRRIAIVDDDPIFMEHVASVLLHQSGMRAVCVSTGEELIKTMRELDFACVLIDYDLNGETGLSIGQTIKNQAPGAPPIIMLTGAGSERTATKAFRIGFSDYVSKRNLDANELITAIRSAIAHHEEKEALRLETERLRELRRVDSLTGLASASFVKARLAEISASHAGKGLTLVAVLMGHMDDHRLHFGHAAGERMFRDFAARLGNADLRGGYLGHLSAHHLVCIFEEIVSEDVIRAAIKNLRAAATFNFDIEGTSVAISPAFGCGQFPEDGNSVDDVIAFALSEAHSDELKPTSTPDETMSQGGTEPAANDLPSPDRRETELDIDGDEQRWMQRRIEQRFRVLKKGKIIIDGLNSVVDCTVRNMSSSGVRIRVDGYFAPPGRFKVRIVGSGEEPRWAEKRWQVGNEIGVRFQGDAND